MIERAKALLERRGLLTPESDAAAEILVPILFNFPNAGRLLTLLFIPFAAWLAGSALTATDYWTLLVAGVPSYFAKAQVALPFLMDLLGLPHDLFQLYLMPAEGASAWTLLHPELTAVVPQPDPVKIPTGFGLPLDARDLGDAVNEWVAFATSEGLVQRAHEYWVLGRGAEESGPRWSILRDVLG